MAVTRADIEAAHGRIRTRIRETPVVAVDSGTFGIPHALTLKLELIQHTGSFKPRGAFNNLLSRGVPAAGVAAASGGNHGIAVAYAAGVLGVPAHIFVPTLASPVKIARIRAEGAEVTVEGERYVDALALAEAFIARTGALGIHAYDSVETVAGQGTVAREWEKQAPDLDTLLVAVGGGGLIAGIAAWHKGGTRVISVEPERSRALHAAMEAGRPLDVPVESIAADSLGASRVGDVPFETIMVHVERAITLPDRAIEEAQRRLWRDAHIAAEPGGATALAALTSGAYKPEEGERIGVLICGGNVDLAALDRLVAGPAADQRR
jgi:threonine dehydratase